MAYSALTTAEVDAKSPVTTTLMTKIKDNFSDHETRIASLESAAQIPVGTMLFYGGTATPSGYLACDGSAVSRTTYADLFSVVGTQFGSGDGSTTFNVPDMRRRVPVGNGGAGTGTLANTVGSTGGSEDLSAHTHDMSNHTHSFSATTSSDGSHSHTASAGDQLTGTARFVCTSDAEAATPSTNSAGAHTHTVSGTSGTPSTNTSGSTGTGSHGVMQPSLVARWCIKT